MKQAEPRTETDMKIRLKPSQSMNATRYLL